MEMKSSGLLELSVKGEKGDYILLLPLGSPIEESVKVSEMFTSALQLSLDQYNSKKKEEEVESESVPTASPVD